MKYFAYCRKSSRGESRQKLSIATQHSDIDRMMPNWQSPIVLATLDEERTAKTPGRPLFNKMMDEVEAGLADGIIAWHPDRLSRNPIDAGRIMHALSTGTLKDLKFVAYTFENTPEGRYMLAIMLGQATYYSDALSHRIKVSIRTKVAQGGFPGLAPLGYLNDRNTHSIVPDPERFDVIRDLLRLFLNGQTSARRLWEIAATERGLRTRQHKILGGKPVSLAGIYRMLTNPFYAGFIEHQGQLWPGKHVPMLTSEDFHRIQILLGRPHPSKAQKHVFAFTGMIRCAECGYAVTAEHKRNRHGSEYTYYHCSKRRLDYRCRQPVIHADDLKGQVAAFVESVVVPAPVHDWAIENMEKTNLAKKSSRDTELRSIDAAIQAADRERANLVGMRLRDMLSDDEYNAARRNLDITRARLVEQRQRVAEKPDWFEPARVLLSFSNRAVEYVLYGNPDQQRLVLSIVGSNPVLDAKKLSIEARKPFRLRGQSGARQTWRATMYEVRTLTESADPSFKKMIADMRKLLDSGEPVVKPLPEKKVVKRERDKLGRYIPYPSSDPLGDAA